MISARMLFIPTIAILAAQGLGQERAIAIQNVRIVVAPGRVIESGTIVFRAGKIVSAEASPAPQNADLVEGRGMVAYAGFIDLYGTRGLKLPEPPAAGTPPDARNTAPAFMWDKNRKGVRGDIEAAKHIDIDSQLSDYWKQGFTTALLAPGGGLVRGQTTVINLSAEAAKSPLIERFGQELSFRGGSGGGYPSSLMGQLALLRQTLLDAQTYQTRQTEKDPVMEGMQSIFSGSPTVIAADSEREIGRALMFAREFGMKAIVAGGSDSFRMKERLKAANIPVVVRIDLTDPPRAEAGVPAPILVERKLNWENRAGNLSALALEGVPFGLSTMGAPVGDFLTNARKLIGRGLASDSVLAGLTTQAAKILGLENQLGTLEPGKTANLVLFDGPFEDAKSTVKMIFVQGKKQEPAK